jgi:hypothetical protein
MLIPVGNVSTLPPLRDVVKHAITFTGDPNRPLPT